MNRADDSGLVRGIRLWDLVGVVINSILGAGIFVVPAKAFGLIGPYSVIAFIVCALVVSLIILCFAEVSSRFSETGGPYLYARAAFGATFGFQVGWMLWLARLAAVATNSNLFVVYLSFFWPAAGTGWWRAAIITMLVGALTIVNVIGVREAALVSNFFTVGKLLPLFVFVAVGLFFLQPQNLALAAPPAYGDFSLAVLLLIYAFTGFENAGVPAGEIQNPRRNLPLAILIAVALIALLYISIQIVCAGTLPATELAASEKPLADASRIFLGAAGASMVAAGALISIIGNLNAAILTAPRLPFAMASRRELPRFLAAIHHRWRTPYVAILLTAAAMWALTISSSLIYALTLSTIARLLAYGATCAALPVLRRRTEAPPALFVVPAGGVIAVTALLLTLWLLSNSTWREARDAAIAAACGLLIYLAYRWRARRQPAKESPSVTPETS